MPPKKKAKTWIMGPGGALIEKTAATAHAAPVSAAGGGARGPERLTDGLTSFTPAAVAMNMKGPAQSKKTAAAPWTAQRRRNQELSTVRSEIAAGLPPSVRSSKPSSKRSSSTTSSRSSSREVQSRSPSPAASDASGFDFVRAPIPLPPSPGIRATPLSRASPSPSPMRLSRPALSPEPASDNTRKRKTMTSSPKPARGSLDPNLLPPVPKVARSGTGPRGSSSTASMSRTAQPSSIASPADSTALSAAQQRTTVHGAVIPPDATALPTLQQLINAQSPVVSPPLDLSRPRSEPGPNPARVHASRSSSTVNNTNGVNESNAPAPSNTIQRPPGASATVPGGTPPVFALGQPITTTQTLPDATDPPQQSALSIAEKLRLKTASTLASVGVLPPTLNCIPGPKVGTSILLPGGFRDVLNELEPERAARPRYFELRGGMKQGKLRKAVAGVCDWIAPPGKIGLSPSVMRQLAVEAGEAVNIKELRLGACEKVVLEVSSAAMRGKGEDGLRDVVRQAWGGLACLGVDDVFREAGIRFKVTDTRPREVSCALPPKTANGEFNQFLQNQLEFRVKESTDAIKVVEMSATPGKAAFLRITSEDVVRVVASLDDSQTDPSSERSGKPLHHTGNLRLTAKKPQGTQLSSTLLYVTQGEELPTLSSFTWGGSNSVDIPIDGETIVCHVLPQGDPCTLHAHVLIKKQAAPSVQAEAFAQQSRPGSGFSEQSELILSYFQALSRVPSPVEVAARLPSGFELSYLTCFDELFGIERGSANGSISAQVSSFAPPHAAEWAEKLAGRLPSMPLHVRVPLALTLSPIELRKCSFAGLSQALQSAEGQVLLLFLLSSLGDRDVAVRNNALLILKTLNKG